MPAASKERAPTTAGRKKGRVQHMGPIEQEVADLLEAPSKITPLTRSIVGVFRS
jgi:hypothetical protein